MNKKTFIVKGLTFALGSMLFAACNMVDNPVEPTPGEIDEPIIEPVEQAWVYTNSLSEEAGGVKVVGAGSFVDDPLFGKVYQNVGGAQRTNYLLLPEDVFAHSAETKELSIGFWVKADGLAPGDYTYCPFLGSYGAAPNTVGNANDNNWPVFVIQSRGPLQINNAGWSDFTGAQHVDGKVNIYNSTAWEANDPAYNFADNWLADGEWHYYTLVLTVNNVKCYMDGTVKNEWNLDGVSDGQVLTGFFENGANHKYNCLGGNQAWSWGDPDSPFKYAQIRIQNTVMTEEDINAIVAGVTDLMPAVQGLENAGRGTSAVQMDPNNDYGYEILNIDVDAIAQALGCEASAIELKALGEDLNFADPTANNGGFWLTADGFVTGWGNNSAFFIEPENAGDLSVLHIGQFPNAFSEGGEANALLFFVGGGKYFVQSVTLGVNAPKKIDVTLESVGEETLTFEQAVSGGYVWSEGIAIPSDKIAEAIGTSDWVLYGQALLDDNGNEKQGNAKYVKNYTCDPAPGFWLDKDGRNSGWGDNAFFGLTIAETAGMVQMMQFPDRCAAGETYSTKVFFVNEETGKMFTLNLVLNVK